VFRVDLIRVASAALALCALSFTVGIIGDLSAQPDAHTGTRVVLAIPPEMPATAAARAVEPTPERDDEDEAQAGEPAFETEPRT
jgi:hypothetical protein